MEAVPFDVREAWDDTNGRPANRQGAIGVSNGIGFLYSGPNWAPGVTTDGSFDGFANISQYNPPLVASDRIHIAGNGFFVFTEPLDCVDLYLAWHEDSPHQFLMSFRKHADESNHMLEPEPLSGDIYIDKFVFGANKGGGIVRLQGLCGSQKIWFSAHADSTHCVDLAIIPHGI